MDCARQRQVENPQTSKATDDFDFIPALQLIDPEESAVAFDSIDVTPGDFGEDFTVPTFSFRYQDADYVQILRCASRFSERFAFFLGRDSNDAQGAKWAWYDSLGSTDLCRIAAHRTTIDRFQDISARNGSFFYIINPCVSAHRSTTGRDTCSFRLVKTSEIHFEGSLSAAFQQKASELIEAEARYNTLVTELKGLTDTLLMQRRSCETQLQLQKQDHRKNQLRHTAIAAIAGAAASGAGFLGARKYLKETLKTTTDQALVPAALFSGVTSLTLIVQNLLQSSPNDAPACRALQETALRIMSYQEEGAVDRAQAQMIETSRQLSQLDATFQGYDRALFEAATSTQR